MRLRYLYLLAAALLCTAAAGTVVFQYCAVTAPSLQEALGASQTPLAQSLYSAVPDAKSGAPLNAIDHSVRVGDMLYESLRDHSTVDVRLKQGTDDQTVSSQSYYPKQPGESGRRPHVKQLYDGLPQVSFDEEVWHLSGTMAEHTQIFVDKSKHIVDYAPNGKTLVDEQWFNPPNYGETDLREEERWRLDATHSLAYRDHLNLDETRTITEYDEHMNALKIARWPKDMSVSGATVVAYYPGSFKLRLESKSDYQQDIARYYREDGTLAYRVTISASITEVETLDATGTRTLMDQTFWRTETSVNGVKRLGYKLYTAALFDDQGNKIRDVDFEEDPTSHRQWITFEELYNATVDGVAYKEVDYVYKPDGTRGISIYKSLVEGAPDKRVEHKPAENIRPDPVPPEMMAMHFQPDQDLPIPPPQRGAY
jgi:hypothetical protein